MTRTTLSYQDTPLSLYNMRYWRPRKCILIKSAYLLRLHNRISLHRRSSLTSKPTLRPLKINLKFNNYPGNQTGNQNFNKTKRGLTLHHFKPKVIKSGPSKNREVITYKLRLLNTSSVR